MALRHCKGVNNQERADQTLLEIFCVVDDFCEAFRGAVTQEGCNALPDEATGGKKLRNRLPRITPSEIMTILIYFHNSRFRDFKTYYNCIIKHYRAADFPAAPSYTRFVELVPRVIFTLTVLLVTLFGKCTGISFVDSTKIEVCSTKRESSHKVFKDVARKGKTSTGWFYGFKLHIICNDYGELLWVYLTPGNVDDRTALEHMLDCEGLTIFGKIFGDKGYISSRLFKKFIEEKHIKLVTSLRSNMKSDKPLEYSEAELLRKRSIIESVNDQLKNISQIQHTRHRSQTNFLINVICGLIAYCLQPHHPSLYPDQAAGVVAA